MSKPFWDACGRGELQLPHCLRCDRAFYYPRRNCPHCGSAELDTRKAAGTGRVFSFTHVHVSFYGSQWESQLPYTPVLVDLDEGVRMLSRLIGPDREIGCSRRQDRCPHFVEIEGQKLPFSSEPDQAIREEPMKITRRQALAGALGTAFASLRSRRNGRPSQCSGSAHSRRVAAQIPFWAAGWRVGQPIWTAGRGRQQARRISGDRYAADRPGRPDGYTVGLLTDVHCVSLALGQDLGYDADKDFTYISQLIRVPMGMFTSAKNPELKTLPSLIAYAKANPGKLTAASIGPSTPHHLAVEWLKAVADIDVVAVNFKGIPQGISRHWSPETRI